MHKQNLNSRLRSIPEWSILMITLTTPPNQKWVHQKIYVVILAQWRRWTSESSKIRRDSLLIAFIIEYFLFG